MMKFPTVEELAQNVAEKALDEWEYKGKTLRQWVEIILATDINVATKQGTDCISRQAAIDALNEYFDRIGKLKRRGLNKGEKAISLDTVGAIKTLPPAEPKKMHWNKKMSIRHINGAVCYIPKWHCPNCDLEYDFAFAQRVNFCYACGQWLEGLVNVVNEVTE